MMVRTDVRSLGAILIALVVGFAASLVGCASAVSVSDIKTVAGTWKGVIYPKTEQDRHSVALTIREDGSYDVVTVQEPIGRARSKGTMSIRDGRLILEGERGQGVGRLVKDRDGSLTMIIDATLSDNSSLRAQLTPSK